jgi:hypothetical protein
MPTRTGHCKRARQGNEATPCQCMCLLYMVHSKTAAVEVEQLLLSIDTCSTKACHTQKCKLIDLNLAHVLGVGLTACCMYETCSECATYSPRPWQCIAAVRLAFNEDSEELYPTQKSQISRCNYPLSYKVVALLKPDVFSIDYIAGSPMSTNSVLIMCDTAQGHHSKRQLTGGTCHRSTSACCCRRCQGSGKGRCR